MQLPLMKIILVVAFVAFFLGLCLGLFVPALGCIRRIRRSRLRPYTSRRAKQEEEERLLPTGPPEDDLLPTRPREDDCLLPTGPPDYKDRGHLLRIREEQWQYIKQMVEGCKARDVDDIVQEIPRIIGDHVTNKVLDDIKKIHRHRKQTSPIDPNGIQRLISLLKSSRCPSCTNYQDDERLQAAIDTIVKVICSRLTSFEGKLIPVGSTQDRTRVSACSDFDFLFELTAASGFQDDTKNIRLQQLEHEHLRLVLCREIIKPLRLYQSFAEEIGDICDDRLQDVFPTGLAFGGFAQPAFSGVRFNEPAVTLIFRWTDSQNVTQITSADITLAIKIPKNAEPTLTNNIATQVSALPFRHDHDFFELCETVRDKCHLVPVWPYADEWFLTTAALDKWIFEQLIETSGITATIRECKQRAKFLSDTIEQTYQRYYPDTTGPIRPQQDFLATRLDEYSHYMRQDNIPREKLTQLRSSLSELISVGHIFLSATIAEHHSEISSKLVSFNSAAFKYKTLSLVLSQQFETDDINSSIVKDNLRTGQIEHTFLGSVVRLVALGYGAIINSDVFNHVVEGTGLLDTSLTV